MSTDPNKPKAVLHAPEQAIDTYLAALLSEVEEYQETTQPILAPPVDETPKLAKVVEIRQGVHTEAPVQAPPAIEIVPSVDTAVETPESLSSEPVEIIPEWGRSSFQCLPFKVRGMNLVVPLTALSSITEWDQDLTQIPGQPDWYMGVFVHRDQRVVVIDTAQLIMPERMEKVSDKRRRGSHVLIIGDGRWGLACDSLQSPLVLEKESVRWRRGEGCRSWMAGTVIDQLSVLLNVDALLDMVGHK
ncbi:chemotaxis protein CheW [Sedimenticola sp.]|uniref:chemotaxis protein CheW n=1 Tax=Sedimenticola sp. TaxID=1940285 RepID=UPI003D0A7BA2